MSTEPPSEEEVFDILVEHEEELLKLEGLITDTLNFRLKESTSPKLGQDVFSDLADSLSPTIPNRTERGTVAYGLMMILGESYNTPEDQLQEADASSELVEFITRIKNQFKDEVSHLIYRETQGEHYWVNLQTDLVIRDPQEAIGMNHKFEVSHDRITDISVDLDGNLNLIHELVSEQNRAIERFGDEALHQISSEIVEEIEEAFNEFKDLTEEVESEDDADG